MPFGIQPLHLVIIAVVALIVFGPSKLPEIGRGAGKALSEFRKGLKDMSSGFQDEVSQPVGQPPDQQPLNTYLAPAVNPQPVPPQTQVQAAPQPTVYRSVSTPPAAAPAEQFCTQCGSPNQASARFCNTCGSPLAIDVSLPGVNQNSVEQSISDELAQ